MPSFSSHVTHTHSVQLGWYVGPTTTRSNDRRVRRRRKRPLMSIACGSSSCIGVSFDEKNDRNLKSFPTIQGRCTLRVCIRCIRFPVRRETMRKPLEIEFTISSSRSRVYSPVKLTYLFGENSNLALFVFI